MNSSLSSSVFRSSPRAKTVKNRPLLRRKGQDQMKSGRNRLLHQPRLRIPTQKQSKAIAAHMRRQGHRLRFKKATGVNKKRQTPSRVSAGGIKRVLRGSSSSIRRTLRFTSVVKIPLLVVAVLATLEGCGRPRGARSEGAEADFPRQSQCSLSTARVQSLSSPARSPRAKKVPSYRFQSSLLTISASKIKATKNGRRRQPMRLTSRKADTPRLYTRCRHLQTTSLRANFSGLIRHPKWTKCKTRS